MRVLVVDDSRAMRMILKTALHELGCEVTEASNGQDGLELIRHAGPFRLALVDWNMPVLNGYEFVQAVRSNHAYDSMKVVKALGAGADEYVMKPFTREILKEKIEMLAIV